MSREFKPDSYEDCQGCPLLKGREKPRFVVTERGPEAPASGPVDVVFVGEGPGEEENAAKRPFMGMSGDKLRRTIARVVDTKSYAFSNAVRCRPTDAQGKNRAPTDAEVKHCRPYLIRDLKALNPRLIVPLGSVALAAATPEGLFAPEGVKPSVMKTHGQIRESKKGGRRYLPVYHPSYVLRNPSEDPTFTQDLAKVQFGLATSAAETPFMNKGKSIHLDTMDKVLEYLRFLREDFEGAVATDIETENLYRVAPNRILSVQLAHTIEDAYIILLDHINAHWTPEERHRIKKALKKTFTKAKKVKVWVTHNGKFDYDKLASQLGAKVWSAPIVDTMFMSHLLDDNRAGSDSSSKSGKGYKLKVLAREWLNFHHYEDEALREREGGGLEKLPLKKFIRYGGMDAYVTLRLFRYILQQAEKEGYRSKLLRLAVKWGARMLTMIPTMERWGFPIDVKQLELLSSDASPVRHRLKELHEILNGFPETKKANAKLLGAHGGTAGMTPLFGGTHKWLFDFGKKSHLEVLCFDVMRLKPVSFGKPTAKWPEGAPAIDRSFLDEYAPDPGKEEGRETKPPILALKEYKGLVKLETSYVESIRKYLFDVTKNGDNKLDFRIRASFHITRTVTGRWASSDVNLQQAPRPDNDAKASIKNLYRASPGHLLLEADYGQAEIRWWAHISQDKVFIQRFKEMAALEAQGLANPKDEALHARIKNECDIHRQVASLMFNVPIGSVTKDMRQAAKSLAFGAIYGQHYKTLAKILKKKPDEALEIQKRFLSAFTRAGTWLDTIQTETRANGYVESPMGRRRRLHAMYASGDEGMIQAAGRRARNSPIQAQSSDTTALAAWLMVEYIREHKKPWKLLNVVHDALTLEVPMVWAEVNEASRVLHEIMTVKVMKVLAEDFDVKVEVPFSVDYKLGLKWGAMGTEARGEKLHDEYKRFKKEHQKEVRSGWCAPMAMAA